MFAFFTYSLNLQEYDLPYAEAIFGVSTRPATGDHFSSNPSKPPGAAAVTQSATRVPVADARPVSAPSADPACGGNGA